MSISVLNIKSSFDANKAAWSSSLGMVTCFSGATLFMSPSEPTQVNHSDLRSPGTSSSHAELSRVASWNINFPGRMMGPRNPRGSKIDETILRIRRLVIVWSWISLTSNPKVSELMFHFTPRTFPWTLGDQSRTSLALWLSSISPTKFLSFTTNFVKVKPPSNSILGVSWITVLASSLSAHECKRSST